MEPQTLCVLFAVAAVATRVRAELSDYRTAYACEGSQLRITCEEDHLIHLLRANYGRFSISICNEHGNLDWSVDCKAKTSYFVIGESCSMKPSCIIPASSIMFGDPCPGTLKYLEAHYQCITAESTSTVDIPRTTAATTTVTTTARPAIIIPITRFNRPAAATLFHPATTPIVILPTNPVLSSRDSSKGSETGISHSISGTITIPPSNVTYAGAGYTYHAFPKTGCSPSSYRNLIWNWTRPGEIVWQKCPRSTKGLAKWQCSEASATWVPDHPDLSECSSLWVDNLKHRIIIGDSVASIATELNSITRTKPLYGGDVLQTMELIHSLISKMTERIYDMTEEVQRRKLLEEFLESIIDISNNLLEDSDDLFWKELPPNERKRAVSGLIHGLERCGWLLADAQNNLYHLTKSQPSILMTVRVVEAKPAADIKFPSPEDVDGTPWTRMEDSLILSTHAVTENSPKGILKVVMMAYSKVDEFLGVDVLHYGSAASFSLPSELPSAANLTHVINTRIIAASLDGYRTVRLAHPVTIILRHVQEENVTNPLCVFWDFNMRIWSTEGCWTLRTNATHTVCQCEHLTNFAVMMNVSARKIALRDSIILRIITYVGCAICMLFLAVTLLILNFYRSIKTDRITIHKNLCSCLLLAESTFVAGIDRTEFPTVCSILSGLLHYFLLAAFAWMFLENFQLYIMLVEMFESEKSRLRWYCTVGYGVPLLVVGTSAAIDPYSFGTERYCWLRLENYYVFSFVGPAIACTLGGAVLLFLIFCRICCQSSETVVKSKGKMKLTSAKVWSGEAFVLLLTLNSTWAISMLYLHKELPVVAYIFATLNSLQGFLIFAFYCLKNEKVRKALQRSAKQDVWFPDCIHPSHSQDSGSHLYRQSNGAVIGSGQPNMHHRNRSLLKTEQYAAANITPLRRITQDQISAATLDNFEIEEFSMRSLHHVRSDRLTPLIDSEMPDPYNADIDSRVENATLPRDRVTIKRTSTSRIKNDIGKIRPTSENLYEDIGDDASTVRKYDPLPAWEVRTISRSNQNIINSLTAVLTGSPRTRHLPLLCSSYLRPQVAYSGIHTPSDSERSSSSLMNEREGISSSSSPDISSSPEFEKNSSQSLQSLHNMDQATEQLTLHSADSVLSEDTTEKSTDYK